MGTYKDDKLIRIWSWVPMCIGFLLIILGIYKSDGYTFDIDNLRISDILFWLGWVFITISFTGVIALSNYLRNKENHIIKSKFYYFYSTFLLLMFWNLLPLIWYINF